MNSAFIPFGSLQFFQLLEKKNGRWGEVTQSYLGVIGFSERFWVKSFVTGYYSNKEDLIFLMGTATLELCL